MKMRWITPLLAVLMVYGFAVALQAITVNPASNVTADSANTAQTIVLRGTSGEISVGAITVTGAVTLTTKTKAQLKVLVPALGDIYSCSDCSSAYSLVIATGTSAGQFAQAAWTTY